MNFNRKFVYVLLFGLSVAMLGFWHENAIAQNTPASCTVDPC